MKTRHEQSIEELNRELGEVKETYQISQQELAQAHQQNITKNYFSGDYRRNVINE